MSRITDSEMKMFMIFACEKVEELLRLKQSDLQKYATFILKYNLDWCRKWER